MSSVPIVKGLSLLSAGCLFTAALMSPVPSFAEDAPAAKPADKSVFDVLDKPRDFLSERFVSLSSRMDGFFADERVFQEANKNFIRLYGDLTYSESHASDFTIKVQSKFVLPGLEKRLKLLIESDDPNLTSNDENSSFSTVKGAPNVDVPKGFWAGLQYLLTDTPHWNINTDAGIRIHSFAPDPFGRIRASRTMGVRDWLFRFTESVYWFEQTGAGSTTQFDADRKLSDEYLGRSRSVAIWSDHDQLFDFEQSFFLFHPIDNNNALSYQFGIFGTSQPNSRVTDYSLSAKWRHRLHNEWLFFEVQPVLSWPEDQSFRPTTSILFRVEAIFGGVACGCYGM